jgi:membrane protease YdiL (CAAX protease family)
MEVLSELMGVPSEPTAASTEEGPEHFSWILLIPFGSAVVYYIFFYPADPLLLVFTPILLTFASLIYWCRHNGELFKRLRLRSEGIKGAIKIGVGAGVGLAIFNLFVILKLTVWLGYSYDFLRLTPHAHFPFWLMFPFGILMISLMIEVLFRGFILGRLWLLMQDIRGGTILSIFLSALLFSFDPFMMIYFRGYHWLALIDGVVWGGLLLKTENLASSIAAHTVEVWIIYFILKIFYV